MLKTAFVCSKASQIRPAGMKDGMGQRVTRDGTKWQVSKSGMERGKICDGTNNSVFGVIFRHLNQINKVGAIFGTFATKKKKPHVTRHQEKKNKKTFLIPCVHQQNFVSFFGMHNRQHVFWSKFLGNRFLEGRKSSKKGWILEKTRKMAIYPKNFEMGREFCFFGYISSIWGVPQLICPPISKHEGNVQKETHTNTFKVWANPSRARPIRVSNTKVSIQ